MRVKKNNFVLEGVEKGKYQGNRKIAGVSWQEKRSKNIDYGI